MLFIIQKSATVFLLREKWKEVYKRMVKKTILVLAIFFFSQLFIIDCFIKTFPGKNECYAAEFEEDMEGFGEDELSSDNFPDIDFEISDDEKVAAPSNFSPGGFIKQVVEYGFNRDDRKLSKFKSVFNADIKYKINPNWSSAISVYSYYDSAYKIDNRDKYDDKTLEDNESEISLRELFIYGKLSEHLTMKVGRQILAWGESDFSRITDIINPRDMKQPGLTNLEDARLPTAAVRFSYESAVFLAECVTIHEHPGNSISRYGSDFDYYASLRKPFIIIKDEKQPASSLENTGFALRFTRFFNGADISFYASDSYDHLPVLTANSIEFSGQELQSITMTPEYFKYKTLGFTGQKTKGSVLYKFESAFLNDKKIMRNDFLYKLIPGMSASELDTIETKDQLKLLLGIEYTGISDLRTSLEIENTHTLDYKNHIVTDENEKKLYFQSTYNLLNDTLEMDLLWVYFNRGKGNILRLSTNYDIIDNLNFEAGIIFYDADSDESDLYPYKEQDRIFSRIKYNF